MVYSALTITPMHNLMVTISVMFFLVAVLPITWALYGSREIGCFVGGCVCVGVFVASATIYYAGLFPEVLPWAQRASYALFAVWLLWLDYRFPRSTTRTSK